MNRGLEQARRQWKNELCTSRVLVGWPMRKEEKTVGQLFTQIGRPSSWHRYLHRLCVVRWMDHWPHVGNGANCRSPSCTSRPPLPPSPSPHCRPTYRHLRTYVLCQHIAASVMANQKPLPDELVGCVDYEGLVVIKRGCSKKRNGFEHPVHAFYTKVVRAAKVDAEAAEAELKQRADASAEMWKEHRQRQWREEAYRGLFKKAFHKRLEEQRAMYTARPVVIDPVLTDRLLCTQLMARLRFDPLNLPGLSVDFVKQVICEGTGTSNLASLWRKEFCLMATCARCLR